jgi:hypothetical protein
MREIRRRTRVVGAFPDGQVSADAGGGQAPACGWYQVGIPAVSEHGTTQRTPVGDSIITEPRGLYGPRLSISSKPTDCWVVEIKSAKNSLHYLQSSNIPTVWDNIPKTKSCNGDCTKI